MKNNFLQMYYKVVHGYMSSPFLCGSRQAYESPLIDFKPLWAIKRAMDQQSELIIN